MNINPDILNAEHIDLINAGIMKDKDCNKSETESQTYESIEELKYPQEYYHGGIILLDDFIEKKMNDNRVQAMFKRSRQTILSVLIISQDYYHVPKGTIRTNGNI